MKPLMLIGILLIALGVVALAYEGITYTRSKTVVDLGPIQARVEEKRTIPLPPILGAVALAWGIALIVVSARTSRPA